MKESADDMCSLVSFKDYLVRYKIINANIPLFTIRI